MAHRFSHVSAQETFVTAALIAAHAAGDEGGFRPADVRFYFLLFTNWVEHDVLRPSQELELTQVRRVLARLIESGLARAVRRGSRPRYALSDEGLVTLAEELVDPPAGRPRRSLEESLFVICFGALYRGVLAKRLRLDAAKPSLRRRLARLLDPQRALVLAQRRARELLADLEMRCRAGEAMQAALDEEPRGSDDARVARLNALGSYQLERVRPVEQLLAALPRDLREIELRRGPGTRVALLFHPLSQVIRHELEVLERLAPDHSLPTRGPGPMGAR